MGIVVPTKFWHAGVAFLLLSAACEPTETINLLDAGPDAARDVSNPAPTERLGQACQRDAQCPDGAFCLTEDSTLLYGGAPPSGTCVADCSTTANACDQFLDAVCVAVATPPDADAGAGVASASALCFERCSLGEAPSNPAKCHDRPKLACAPLTQGDGDGFCRPVCSADADCGSGLCDGRYGICVDGAPRDSTFGRACDATASMCDGLCLTLNAGDALCSRSCVFGDIDECAPTSGGLRRGACLFVASGGSIGDLGYCGELCDCTDDCTDSTFVCDAFENGSLEAAFGRLGTCTPPTLVINSVLACE